MEGLCKYRHIFGKEKEGVHQYRIFNIAIVDTLLTILAAWLIAYYFKLNFWIVVILLFIIAILVHRLFCVETTLTKLFFN
jgi:fatty acid desaturase